MNIKLVMFFIIIFLSMYIVVNDTLNSVCQTKIERTTLAHERAIELAYISNKCK